MASLEHPAPTGMHGLLTLRRNHTFSKRHRRLATLENGILTLRPSADSPPDVQLNVLGSSVIVDNSSHTLILNVPTLPTSTKIRLSAHSRMKFSLWARALTASSTWIPSAYYDFKMECNKVSNTKKKGMLNRTSVDGTHRSSGTSVSIVCVSLCSNPCKFSKKILSHCIRISRLIASFSNSPFFTSIRDVFDTPCTSHVIFSSNFNHTLQCVFNQRQAKPFTEGVVAKIIASLLQALDTLHSHSIVHRSISLAALNVPASAFRHDWNGEGIALGCFDICTFTTNRANTKVTTSNNDKENQQMNYSVMSKRIDVNKNKLPSVYTCIIKDQSDANSACCGAIKSEKCGEIPSFTTPLYLGNTISNQPQPKSQDALVALSSGIDRLTLTDAIAAPAYAAPEIASLQCHGSPVDMWAVGVITGQLLGASLPEGKTEVEVLNHVKNGYEMDIENRLKLNGVSENARSFVSALMRVDGRRRLTAEAALSNDWVSEHAGNVIGNETY